MFFNGMRGPSDAGSIRITTFADSLNNSLKRGGAPIPNRPLSPEAQKAGEEILKKYPCKNITETVPEEEQEEGTLFMTSKDFYRECRDNQKKKINAAFKDAISQGQTSVTLYWKPFSAIVEELEELGWIFSGSRIYYLEIAENEIKKFESESAEEMESETFNNDADSFITPKQFYIQSRDVQIQTIMQDIEKALNSATGKLVLSVSPFKPLADELKRAGWLQENLDGKEYTVSITDRAEVERALKEKNC